MKKSKYFIIGDIHGCMQELIKLLAHVGIEVISPTKYKVDEKLRDGRLVISAGDLCDRGPGSDKVLELFMNLREDGLAYNILGNHEAKLFRYLKGNPVKINHGLDKTIEQLDIRGKKFKSRVFEFLKNTPWIFEDEDLIVVHGAYVKCLKEKSMKGFALHGDVDREAGYTPEGHPVRLNNWKEKYKGTKTIVHGHVIVPEPELTVTTVNAKIWDIDTGCILGGKLTGLMFPEEKFIQVKAKKVYWSK